MERYSTLGVLGRGSFGVALLVSERGTAPPSREPQLQQLRVVKVVDFSKATPEAQKEAKKEAELLRSLSHPNVITYRGAFVRGDRLHIVMEYADGGDLGSVVARRREAGQRFEEGEALSVLLQCGRGLRHVHERVQHHVAQVPRHGGPGRRQQDVLAFDLLPHRLGEVRRWRGVRRLRGCVCNAGLTFHRHHDAAEARLRDIAGRNGGEVPLHGRLFAEFLHNAFPTDCPYPHLAEDASAFSPGRWSSGKHKASEEERRQHVEAAPGDWERGELGATTAWSEEEVLPVLEAPRRARGAWSGFARSAAQAAAALAVLRIALSGLRAARGAAGGAGKEKGLVLPLRV